MSNQSELTRKAWLAGLVLYALAAGGDFGYHLMGDLHTRNQIIQFSEVTVAFSAALFWPLDIIAMRLLATR